MLLAFPLIFISKAFVQIGQYVKNQRWTNHYEMSAIMNTTNRFRAIDFSTDLVIGFFIYSEIFSRAHYGEPFISNIVFVLLLITFISEKVLRFYLCRKIL